MVFLTRLWFTKCVYSDQWPHGHGHIRLFHKCWQEPVTRQDIPDRNSSVTEAMSTTPCWPCFRLRYWLYVQNWEDWQKKNESSLRILFSFCIDDSLLKTTVLTVRLQNWEDGQKMSTHLGFCLVSVLVQKKMLFLATIHDHSWNGYMYLFTGPAGSHRWPRSPRSVTLHWYS
jgi:hypothetical protein